MRTVSHLPLAYNRGPMTPEPPMLATRLTILTALLGPPLFVFLSRWLLGRNPLLAIQIILELLFYGFAVLVLWVVTQRERLPLDSIGLRRPDWSTPISAVLLCIGLRYLLPVVTNPLVDAMGTEGYDAGLNDLVLLPPWFRLIAAITGPIVEEILYRGYAIERLATLTGSIWIGGAISATVFGLAHIPTWGIGFALGVDLPFGIVMTIFYIWKRDLLANILVHSGGLVVAMLTVVP